jgi:hypothetical protein
MKNHRGFIRHSYLSTSVRVVDGKREPGAE